MMGNLLQ